MKSLEFRNIFFAPDEKGKGKIKESTKGAKLLVSRDDLKRMIENPEIARFDIPVEDIDR